MAIVRVRRRLPRHSESTPLSRLVPFADDGEAVNVVVETARGDRNKLAYDEDLRIFRLKKVLPEGMSFPYDFGFVPSTLAEDGDPLDALVLMDEPATAGCLVVCRLVGVIQGEQRDDGGWLRNDRLISVAVPNHTNADLKTLKDLNGSLLKELEEFFVNYHALEGKTYRLLGCKGPKRARELLEGAIKAFRKRHHRKRHHRSTGSRRNRSTRTK
jgi:inorganic pyrophosphatase